ncbi:PAS domain S-box protein [Halioxenophilus aromaticivorans]|uniref:PAS domain S-box protein n=1 Tax=Halioxenophilus aromaticivorans TaxID=1306992 RepID=UPI0031E9D982
MPNAQRHANPTFWLAFLLILVITGAVVWLLVDYFRLQNQQQDTFFNSNTQLAAAQLQSQVNALEVAAIALNESLAAALPGAGQLSDDAAASTSTSFNANDYWADAPAAVGAALLAQSAGFGALWIGEAPAGLAFTGGQSGDGYYYWHHANPNSALANHAKPLTAALKAAVERHLQFAEGGTATVLTIKDPQNNNLGLLVFVPMSRQLSPPSVAVGTYVILSPFDSQPLAALGLRLILPDSGVNQTVYQSPLWRTSEPSRWQHGIDLWGRQAQLELQYPQAPSFAFAFTMAALGLVIAGWVLGRRWASPKLKGQANTAQSGFAQPLVGADATHLPGKILAKIPQSVAYVDAHRTVQYASPDFARLFNQPVERMLGQPLVDFIHPALMSRLQSCLDKALAGVEQVIENNYHNDDGGLDYVVSRVIPDGDAGEVQGVVVICYDSTELIESERQLSRAVRENEALMHTIDQQLLFGILDTDNLLVEVNDYACHTMGMSRHRLLGKPLDDERGVALDKTVWAQALACAHEGEIWRGEVVTKRANGEFLCLQGVVVPAFNEHGELECIYTVGMNTTQAKVLLTERDHLNVLFQGVLSTDAGVGIITTDTDGVITLFNRGAELLFGYSGDELVGLRSLSDIVSIENINRPLSEFLAGNAADKLIGANAIECRRKDTTLFPAQLSSSVMKDDKGKPSGYVIFVKNVADEIARQTLLLEKTQQLEIASEVAGLGVWTWNTQNNFFHWNRRMYQLFEEDEHTLPTPSASYFLSRVHPDDREGMSKRISKAAERSGRHEMDFRIYDKAGDVRYLRVNSFVENQPLGTSAMVTGTVLDVSQQLQQENTLRQAIQNADASSSAKSQFLANMSHEIRTPLNAVLGMLQLLQNTSLDKLQQEYALDAAQAAQTLLELLNSILDFSKIEASKLEIDIHSFSMLALMRDLAVVVGSNKKQPVRIVFDVPSDLPSKLLGDATRLKQVLLNLASNAMKFTSHGYVQLRVLKVQKDNNNILLRFEVNDTGIGISKHQQERLFTGFAQAEASTTRKYGGTGLGLAISKKLVELLGGKLHLLSDLGQGTQFWFDLSFPVTDATPLVSGGSTVSGTTAFVISDEPIVARLLTQQLNRMGVTVRCYRQNDLTSVPEISPAMILAPKQVTVAEPVAQWLQQLSVPLIQIGAAGSAEDSSELLLCDPFLPDQIASVVKQALGTKAELPSAATSQPQRLLGFNLLVVEDNMVNRMVAKRLLEQQGANVAMAEGGLSGVAMVTDSEQNFDAVLMDIQMPDIDGYEACRRIRATGRFDGLPILALTANAGKDDKDQCVACGMDGHLVKPMEMDTIVTMLLSLVRSSAMPDENESPMPQENSGSINPTEIVEPFVSISRRFGDNNVLLGMVLNKFIPEVNQQMAQLKQHVAADDHLAVVESLHTLKGVAATVGAKALSAEFAKLEQQLKTDQQLQPVELLSEHILVGVDQLVIASDHALRTQFKEQGIAVEG